MFPQHVEAVANYHHRMVKSTRNVIDPAVLQVCDCLRQLVLFDFSCSQLPVLLLAPGKELEMIFHNGDGQRMSVAAGKRKQDNIVERFNFLRNVNVRAWGIQLELVELVFYQF